MRTMRNFSRKRPARSVPPARRRSLLLICPYAVRRIGFCQSSREDKPSRFACETQSNPKRSDIFRQSLGVNAVVARPKLQSASRRMALAVVAAGLVTALFGAWWEREMSWRNQTIRWQDAGAQFSRLRSSLLDPNPPVKIFSVMLKICLAYLLFLALNSVSSIAAVSGSRAASRYLKSEKSPCQK